MNGLFLFYAIMSSFLLQKTENDASYAFYWQRLFSKKKIIRTFVLPKMTP